jgi:single-stranded DNA-binding protein
MRIQLGDQVIITGPLPRSRGVEFRTTKTGRPFAKFSVRAGSQKMADGTYQDDWVNCTAWGDTSELCRYIQPGQSVLVAGTVHINTFTGRDGEERTSADLNVDFLLPSGSSSGSAHGAGGSTGGFEDMPDDEGDLPF